VEGVTFRLTADLWNFPVGLSIMSDPAAGELRDQ
jgi:hypothetical protein